MSGAYPETTNCTYLTKWIFHTLHTKRKAVLSKFQTTRKQENDSDRVGSVTWGEKCFKDTRLHGQERRKGHARPELLGQGLRRGTLSCKDAMTSDLRPIQRYKNEWIQCCIYRWAVIMFKFPLLSSLSFCLGAYSFLFKEIHLCK